MTDSNQILTAILKSINEDASVSQVHCGVRWTAVESKHCGLASSMAWEPCAHQDEPVKEAGTLLQKSARQLAQYALSESISQASIGLAAINSLIDIDSSKCIEVNASQILEEKGRNKNITIIGYFPFVERLRSVAKNLWVIEKRRELGGYPETAATEFLPQSEVIAISGTTLINHTIEKLLAWCPGNSLKMVLGATTPLSPILFDYGIDIISGSMVIDTERVLRLVSQGASFRQMKQGGVRLLTMMNDKYKKDYQSQ